VERVDEYTILKGGKLSDASILKTLERLQEDVPDLDQAAVESHMMFFRAFNAFHASLADRYEELGISISRFRMLLWLYNSAPEKRTMSELGAAMEASVPNVVRMVQALETLGWVERIENPADRRVTFVRLSSDGLSRFRDLLPRALRIWEDVWSGLTYEEMDILNHILAKLRFSLLSRHVGWESLPQGATERRRRKR
jgi:MarR family 2-MHQ and catechol resistance regulon transcriptional repressor